MGLAGKDVAMQVACMTTDNLKYDQMNVIYLDMRGGWWNSGYMDICRITQDMNILTWTMDSRRNFIFYTDLAVTRQKNNK